jgi:hypothetical protein
MTKRVEALAISWRVARAVREEGWSGEVLAVHPRSCYLLDEEGSIYAVVQEDLGKGPLSLVIASSPFPQPFQHLAVGDTVKTTGDVLLVSDSLDVGLAKAELWDPKPYVAFGGAEAMQQSLAALHQAATKFAPETSLAVLLPYLAEDELPRSLQKVTHFPRSHALMGGLADSLGDRNRRGLKVVTSSLAGLGPGLTPAGDDFLAGVLLALAEQRQQDAELGEIADLLLETAAPRTHEISAAYLKTAHDGEAHERWHGLLGALAAGDTAAIGEAAHGVAQVGETSGADMLAGFLTAMQAVRVRPRHGA